MEDAMYDDDADLIEQVSDDDDDDEGMMDAGAAAVPAAQQPQRQRGTRLTDQVNMDDEPALTGYER
jgi:hypothetical protein